MTDRSDKLAFTLMPVDGQTPILSIGIPAKAWERIKDGTADTIDLSAFGCPIRVMIWGAETHDAAVDTIMTFAKNNGIPVLDERRRDFSIKDLKK